MRALDVDANVLAERETNLDRHGLSKVLQPWSSASRPDAETDRDPGTTTPPPSGNLRAHRGV